jgi:kynurenine formamidase
VTTPAAGSGPGELIRLATSGRVIDLGQPSHAGMPQLPGAPQYLLTLLRRHGDVTRGGDLSTANELVVSICHAGTHIDAIGHVSVDGKLFGGLDAEETQRGVRGLKRLAIEETAPIVRRGILLDVAAMVGVEALAPATAIDGSMLEACARAAGVEVCPGDAVLVRTGWGAYWDDPARYVSVEDGLPGPNLDGARWLSARGARVTGADCLMYEHFHPSNNQLPVHGHLIQGHGINLVENLLLEDLAAASATEFLLVIAPLKLLGASGSPVRPIAIL